MHTYNKTYINRLKERVIEAFHGKEIQSSDCYLLSVEIQRRVDKRVSETTLKRVFGFANSAHNPSQYTLNALAVFCGFNSWNHFREAEDEIIASNSENRQWAEIKTRLSKISFFQLQALKRRNPGWRGEKIRRSWLDDYFLRFGQSSKNVMLFHGPSGYGKTSAISTWLHEKLSDGEGSDDIYLYVDGLSFMQSTVYGYNPITWLAQVFDCDGTGSIENFFQHYQNKAPGYLHIIIDGFNEENLAETHYYAVFGNLLDMIESFKPYQWLKFTLVLRSNIYEKAKRRLPATYSQLWEETDLKEEPIPIGEKLPYTTIELSTLFDTHGVAHSVEEIAASSNYEWLRIPTYLDSFLQLREEFPNVNFRLDELKFLLIRNFLEDDPGLLSILETVGNEEMKVLIQATSRSGDTKTTSDNPVQKRISSRLQRSVLFDKLVGRGMLIMDAGTRVGRCRFHSPYYLAYIYAYYYFHNIGISDIHRFSEHVKSDLTGEAEAARLSFIWFAFFQLEELDFSFLELIGDNQNSVIPSADDLLYFTTSFINHLYHSAGQQYKKRMKNKVVQSGLCQLVMHRTRMPYPRLKHVFHLLLDLDLGTESEFRVRFKMALLAFLKWDESEFITQLEHLTTLRVSVTGQLSIQPVAGLSALYHFFKYGKIDSKNVNDVFNKEFNPEQAAVVEDDYSGELVGYLLLLISPDSELAAQYLMTIRKKIDRLTSTDGIGYTIYDLLTQLLIQMSGERYKSKAGSHPAHTGLSLFHFEDSNEDSMLGYFVQILSLHLDILSGEKDQRMIKRKTQLLEQQLEPMGYTVLSKYFAAIAYSQRKGYSFEQDLSGSLRDHPFRFTSTCS